jgi:hypothetical protein
MLKINTKINTRITTAVTQRLALRAALSLPAGQIYRTKFRSTPAETEFPTAILAGWQGTTQADVVRQTAKQYTSCSERRTRVGRQDMGVKMESGNGSRHDVTRESELSSSTAHRDEQ